MDSAQKIQDEELLRPLPPEVEKKLDEFLDERDID